MDGRFYGFTDSPGLPKPVQSPRPPIVIGGGGARRTPALAARFADEFNLPFAPVEVFGRQRDRVQEACTRIDRDPGSMRFSAALVVCCGADEREVAHRAGRIGREPTELRENGAAGSPEEVVAALRTYADAGASRIYLQVLDLDDLDHLSLLAETVLPEVTDW